MSIIFMLVVLFFPQVQALPAPEIIVGDDPYQSGVELRLKVDNDYGNYEQTWEAQAECFFWAGFFGRIHGEDGCNIYFSNRIISYRDGIAVRKSVEYFKEYLEDCLLWAGFFGKTPEEHGCSTLE